MDGPASFGSPHLTEHLACRLYSGGVVDASLHRRSPAKAGNREARRLGSGFSNSPGCCDDPISAALGSSFRKDCGNEDVTQAGSSEVLSDLLSLQPPSSRSVHHCVPSLQCYHCRQASLAPSEVQDPSPRLPRRVRGNARRVRYGPFQLRVVPTEGYDLAFREFQAKRLIIEAELSNVIFQEGRSNCYPKK